MFKYETFAFLFSWIFPTKADRKIFRKFCEEIDSRKKIRLARCHYERVLNKLSLESKKRKLKVVFLVNEISKWKTQSLYDLMSKSEDFEPVLAFTLADAQWRFSRAKQNEILKNNYDFFKSKGMNCEYAWDFDKNKPMDLNLLNPDIVFYPQPWKIAKNQQPEVVSKYALTCYVPYFVPNYGYLPMDCQIFHKFLYRYYVTNNDWAELYSNYMGEFGSNVYGTGHTMLDNIVHNNSDQPLNNYVIYAPHWSIPHKENVNAENYSTFMWNGKSILEFAKSHPEINWVFKPHPTLKLTLKKIGEWSDEEIENYYSEWDKIATSCYTSDYVDLFLQSKALITDCASFLIEYFCTGKPIVHLVSKDCKMTPPWMTKNIFDTFYKVNNENELFKIFDVLLLKNNDEKCELRQNVLNNFYDTKNLAAANIVKDIRSSIKKD